MNTLLNGKTAEDCGGCEAEQVCGLEQLACDVCTYKDGTYATGALAIWDGCIVESLVDQMVDPTDGWVDVKSPDSEKQWKKLGTIEDLLKLMGAGCPLEVEKAVACMPVSAGEWRCYDGCYRQAKVDLVLVEDADGTLNIPARGEAENARWSKCWTVEDVLNLLNDPKGIKTIDDSDPTTTKVTLNDGTVFTSPEQDEPDRYLANPVLNDTGDAYIWDIMVDGAKVGDETQAIPKSIALNSCFGGPLVDGDEVVKCDEFAGLLEENLTGCLEVADGGQTCGTLSRVIAIECATGEGHSLARITDASLRSGRLSYADHGVGNLPDPFPANPTDHSTFYDYQTLTSDFNAGAVDEALLEQTKIFCADVTVPCDGPYQFYVESTIHQEQGVSDRALGRFVVEVDGEFVTGALGVRPTSTFTNYMGEYQEDGYTVTLTAGTHNICLYYVAASPTFPAAQIGTAAAPLLDVIRVLN